MKSISKIGSRSAIMERCLTAVISTFFAGIHLLSGIQQKLYYAKNPALSFFVLVLVYYWVLSLLFRWLDNQNRAAAVSRVYSEKAVFLFSFTVLLLFWLPYYIASFPGNITYDTFTSIRHNLGIRKNYNNPFFLNWLYGMVYKLSVFWGSFSISVSIYCTIQAVAFLCVLSYAMVLISRSNAPRWLQGAVLLLYGMLPMFPMYSLCMGKDSSFALCLFIFCLGIYEQGIDDTFSSSRKKKLLFFCACALTPLTRNGAVWIVIIPLLMILFPAVTKSPHKINRKSVYILCTLAITLFTGVFLSKLTHSRGPALSESLSIPLQQTAYYFNHYDTTDQEQYVVNKVIPLEAMENYDPLISDPIKLQFRKDATKKEITDYFKIWVRQFFKHPSAYLKAFYQHTNGYYSPGIIYDKLRPHIVLGYKYKEFEDLQIAQNSNPELKLVSQFNNKLMKTFGLRLLQSIGVYFWGLVILFAYALRSALHGKHIQVLPLVPIAFVLLACCFSPVNGYIRYAYPAIICIPILCLLTLFPQKSAKLDKMP